MSKQNIILLLIYASLFLFTYIVMGFSWFLPVIGLIIYNALHLFLPPVIVALTSSAKGKRIVDCITGLLMMSASAALIYAITYSLIPVIYTCIFTSLISAFTMVNIYTQYIGEANIKHSDRANNPSIAHDITQRVRSHAKNIAASAAYMLLLLPTLNFLLDLIFGIEVITLFATLAETAVWLQAIIGLSDFEPKQPSTLLNLSIGLIMLGRISLMLVSTLMLTLSPFSSIAAKQVYNLLSQALQKFIMPISQISVLAGAMALNSRQVIGLKPASATINSDAFDHFKSQVIRHKNATAPAA